jgi:hypothetical protein
MYVSNALIVLWFHHLLLLRSDWEIHRDLFSTALKSHSRSHSLHFVHTRDNFRKQSYAKLVIAKTNCDNLVEKSAWNIRKFTRKLWNCEAPSFTNSLVNTLNKIITHYRWATLHFSSWNFSPTFEHSTPLSYSSFIHYILAVNPA